MSCYKEKGSLIEQITPVNGEAEMPKSKPPLAEHEVELIRRWIAEGAKDDTPADAKQHVDAEHPPLYPRLPVVSSLDYSPDGRWLAAVGGGPGPARRGADLRGGIRKTRSLRSHRSGHPPRSELVAGQQVRGVRMRRQHRARHRGGIHALDRHPSHEVILVGGSDGIPQLFRIFRTTARKIGDNANLIQKYPEMTGRIFSTRFSKDGLKFALGSALEGKGEVSVFGTAKTIETPADIAAFRSKDALKHTPKEAARLREFEGQSGTRISQAKLESAAVYTVPFHPSGDAVAAAESDGKIRILTPQRAKKPRSSPPPR